MKQFKFINLFIILIILSSCFANSKIEEEAVDLETVEIEEIEEVKKYIKPNTDNYYKDLSELASIDDVLGMQVVVFKDQEIIDSFNYGYADVNRNTEINDNTVFRIASTSKMISNILIMKLVDQGKLTLDTNLKELTGLNFDENTKLYHVLIHKSGIVDSSVFNDNMDKVFDIDYLLSISKRYKPDEKYVYSNFNAGTMAAIIETVTHEYFMDYAKRELFDYLDLNAAYVPEYLDENTTIAQMYSGGFIYDPSTWKYNKEFHEQFEIGKGYRLPYGSLLISANDLAKLGIVLAGDGTYKDKSVLSENALNQIRTVRSEASGYPYLMCLNTNLFSDFIEGRKIYGHTGSAYSAYTCLMYDPIDKTGVAVLTNHGLGIKNDKGYNSMLYDIVNLAYDTFFKEGN